MAQQPPPSSRHDLDDTALGAYLATHSSIPNLVLPVKSTKIGYGQSNPTYFVDDAAYAPLLSLPLSGFPSLSCYPHTTLISWLECSEERGLS